MQNPLLFILPRHYHVDLWKDPLEVALVVALAFIIQVQSAAWYVRLSDEIFGPKVD